MLSYYLRTWGLCRFLLLLFLYCCMLYQTYSSSKTWQKNLFYHHSKIRPIKINGIRASLVAQWLRICLLMQGTRVRALVWEAPTCRGATRPVSHNY